LHKLLKKELSFQVNVFKERLAFYPTVFKIHLMLR